MCKFIGKSKERILCKLSKREILRLYSIVHVAIETTKTSHFACQSKFFISIFFTCQISACELQPFSCHDLANDVHSQTAKTMFSLLKWRWKIAHWALHENEAKVWKCLKNGYSITFFSVNVKVIFHKISRNV